jgi:outer membrane protein
MSSLRLVALLAIPAHMAFAQQAPVGPGGSLTLDEAIVTAQRNNPQFQQIRNNVRTANAQVKVAQGALLPSANANFRTGYQQGGTQIVQGLSFPSAATYSSAYSLGLGYNLAPSVLYAPKAARATRDASEADVTSQAEILRSQVTTQYITALQSAAQAAVNDTLVQSAAGQLDLVNAKNKVGAANIVDVRTAEVALGQAQVAALTAHNQAQIDKLKLFQLMGVPADLSVRLTTDFSLAVPNFSLDSLIDLARRVNPDLAAKKSTEYASEMNVKVARTQYLPSLFLSTGYGAQAFGTAGTDLLVAGAQQNAAAGFRSCMTNDSLRVAAGLQPFPCNPPTLSADSVSRLRASNRPFQFNKAPYGLSAQISLPIFNNFQREAQIEQNKVLRDNALADVRSRTLQITTDVTQAYLTMVTDARTVELQTQTAAKASEELAAAQERYKVGAATFLDVTVARGTYEQAQINRVTAIYEYHKAFAALENAVGRPLR